VKRIRIGTRGSPLAMWQAQYVRDRIGEMHPGRTVELKIIKTKGDQAIAAQRYGTLDKGLFTSEIEGELLAGSIDLAVHSLKDLPTDLAEGLHLAAVTVREDPADALVSKAGTLDELPAGATVLTGSLRRRGQLLHRRADLTVVPVRGNVQTRLRKLDESDAHAMILARAGLARCELAGRVTERLDPAEFLPACGQGALAIEVRRDDEAIAGVLSPLEHGPTRCAVTAERAMLTELGGGCQVPVGAYGRFEGDSNVLTVTGMVSSLLGRRRLVETVAGPVVDPAAAEALGRALGQRLRERGGDAILAEIHQRQTESENQA